MIPARGFYCIRAAAENEACLQAFLLCGQAGGRSGFRIDLIRMPEEPRRLKRLPGDMPGRGGFESLAFKEALETCLSRRI